MRIETEGRTSIVYDVIWDECPIPTPPTAYVGKIWLYKSARTGQDQWNVGAVLWYDGGLDDIDGIHLQGAISDHFRDPTEKEKEEVGKIPDKFREVDG